MTRAATSRAAAAPQATGRRYQGVVGRRARRAGVAARPAATGQGARTFSPDAGGSTAEAPQSAGDPQLQSCLPAATAAADPATRPLTPAFFIEGNYQGRAATILVTTSTPQPSRVDLWVFPRDSCTSPVLATARVR